MKKFDASAWATDIKAIPTVVLSPQEDLFAKPSDVRKVAVELDAKLVNLACGHAAIAEMQEKIIELIKKFIFNKT